MKMILFGGLVAALALGASAHADDGEVGQAPPPAHFAAVSELTPLPDFLPGMGRLFVDPATLPAGPFLAYDREGALVSTIYMIPLSRLGPDAAGFDDLATPEADVDHVDVVYNAGHPGVDEPHAHVVLWHVSVAGEARVAE
ncbi:DUF5602 domain-containing protein [Marinicauda salina]|nr:DUF5602 domain-containing protein [Marinicauda salina]